MKANAISATQTAITLVGNAKVTLEAFRHRLDDFKKKRDPVSKSRVLEMNEEYVAQGQLLAAKESERMQVQGLSFVHL